MKNIFKTKLNTASLVLIPACIGINYLGKLFASGAVLPEMYGAMQYSQQHRQQISRLY